MQQQINLKDLSILELKGLYYDFLAQKQDVEAKLIAINQEIGIRVDQQQQQNKEDEQN